MVTFGGKNGGGKKIQGRNAAVMDEDSMADNNNDDIL